MLAHLAAYVGPGWPIVGHKNRKMGTAKNTVKRGSFWWYRVGRRQGRRPLSPSERREGLRQGHGQLPAPLAPGRILLKGYVPCHRSQKSWLWVCDFHALHWSHVLCFSQGRSWFLGSQPGQLGNHQQNHGKVLWESPRQLAIARTSSVAQKIS